MVQSRVSAWRSKFVVSRTSLRCLSFYINKAEVMYRFKQSSAVLELLCPHTDVFCINSYRCSNYYHFLQVDQYTYSFCKGVCLQYWEFPTKKKLKNQDERIERKKKNLYSFQLVRVNIRYRLGISIPVRLRIILRIWVCGCSFFLYLSFICCLLSTADNFGVLFQII